MRRPDQPDWLAIAHDYRRGDVTVQEVCDRHGISKTTLYRQAKARGWPMRQAAIDPETEAGEERGGDARRLITIRRLYKVLDQKMTNIEARAHSDAEPSRGSPAESERDARTLSSLVRVFEKLTELEDRVLAQADSQDANDDPIMIRSMSDAERLRRDLAQRLARLRAAGTA